MNAYVHAVGERTVSEIDITSAAEMKAPDLETWRVARLRGYLVAKRFAVPKLQRNFVWEASRTAKLLDSIYRRMPVGSLFLWEMDRKSANLIRQSSNVLPPFSTSNRRIWFVIDGQQRLSVLYQAFEGEKKKNDRNREIDFGRLCFAVRPDADVDDPPRIVYRKPIDRDFVPLRDILASDWKRRMPTNAKWFLSRIRECRNRVLHYEIPVIIVRSAALAEIGEVFIRLNTQGMRITTADKAIALMGRLDIRAMAEQLRDRLRQGGFELASIDPILMGLNLIAERQRRDGDPPKLDLMARKWSRTIKSDAAEQRRFKKLWHRYQQAFLRAVVYLQNRFPVYDESFLPSLNMLATLSVLFYHQSGQPTRAQAAEIRKWFWATGVGQRYTGRGYHRNIVADARLFKALADGKRQRFAFPEQLEPVTDVQTSEYGSRSARTRAFFCLLAVRRPRYLENGEPIPIGKVFSHADANHRHHIFPQAQMKAHFPARIYNSLCNICFLVSQDNQVIGKKSPRTYLSVYRAKNERRFRQVMRSHLIPVKAGAGVWKGGIVNGFKQFRRERLSLICDEFEREAGMKLFRRG